MIIGVGLYLVFLDATESDVLLNFSSGSLEDVVGGLAADIITYCVLLGYALNLIFTYPMINWGLREVGYTGSSPAACHMLHILGKVPLACATHQVLLPVAYRSVLFAHSHLLTSSLRLSTGETWCAGNC